jgi:ABC-type polysaccharide/polyol phosphate export permease
LRLLWRYISIFLHHAIVLIAVILLFVKVAPVLLLSSLLGLVVLSVNIFWIGVLLGLVSARYRDVPVLISTAFQLLFLVTPVIWPAKVLGAKIGLADLNPFYHFLESVRAPLLEPSSIFFNRHLIISFLIAVVGLYVTIVIFIRWRRRLLYWL